MEELLTIPIVTAIVSIFKTAGLPSRYAPLASLITGITMASMFMEDVWQNEIAVGLIIGLSASGLYSGGKALLSK